MTARSLDLSAASDLAHRVGRAQDSCGPEVDRLYLAGRVTSVDQEVALEVLRCRRSAVGHETARSGLGFAGVPNIVDPGRIEETAARYRVIQGVIRGMTAVQRRALDRGLAQRGPGMLMPTGEVMHLREALALILEAIDG